MGTGRVGRVRRGSGAGPSGEGGRDRIFTAAQTPTVALTRGPAPHTRQHPAPSPYDPAPSPPSADEAGVGSSRERTAQVRDGQEGTGRGCPRRLCRRPPVKAAEEGACRKVEESPPDRPRPTTTTPSERPGRQPRPKKRVGGQRRRCYRRPYAARIGRRRQDDDAGECPGALTDGLLVEAPGRVPGAWSRPLEWCIDGHSVILLQVRRSGLWRWLVRGSVLRSGGGGSGRGSRCRCSGVASVHSSVCSARTAPTRRMTEARSGKIPTTSVRRRISLFRRSCGLLDQIWLPDLAREGGEGQQVVAGVVQVLGRVRELLVQGGR